MNNYKLYFKSELNNDERCCASPCIDVRNGVSVCLNCGMVFDLFMVEEERRAYGKEEVDKRKCTEPRWREFGSRTMLPSVKIDYKGNYINVEQRTLFTRLSKIQNSLISSIERNFWEAKPKMKLLVSKLNIPNYIHETAWKIYTTCAKKKLTMGRSIDGFITASLYVAIRVHEFPKLLEDLSDAAVIPRRTIVRSIGILIREVLPELNLSYKPITAKSLIFKFGNEMNLSIKIQKEALKILLESTRKGISQIGKDPKGFAASALYIAARNAKKKKTQSDVAEIAKITEVTLRTRIRDMKI